MNRVCAGGWLADWRTFACVLALTCAVCVSARAQDSDAPAADGDDTSAADPGAIDGSDAPDEPADAPEPNDSDDQAASGNDDAPAPNATTPAASSVDAAPDATIPIGELAALDKPFVFELSVGAGVGTISMVSPTSTGTQKLPRSSFAAAEIALSLQLAPTRRLSWELALAYQTSIGLEVETDPLFALSQSVDARVERVELGVAPIIKLADGSRAWSLAFPVGFVLRTFVPELHTFGIPHHFLGAPELRAELRFPLSDRVRVRVGPEFQWIVLIDPSLRDQGACCSGMAVGAQALLQADISSSFDVGLMFRESHTFVPSSAWQFTDIERFLIARLAGRW